MLFLNIFGVYQNIRFQWKNKNGEDIQNIGNMDPIFCDSYQFIFRLEFSLLQMLSNEFIVMHKSYLQKEKVNECSKNIGLKYIFKNFYGKRKN